MAYVIIQKKDKEKMSAMVEDILYTAGRLMHCVDELEEDAFGERRNYRDGMGMRDGGRMGYRWEDDPYEMMERRRRRY